jgi:CheY-like chemotaxis protein
LTTTREEAPAAELPQFGPASGALPAPGLRILLAEDNPVNQRLSVRLLEKLGCRTDVAGNGQEAVEMTGRSEYDLILMDCRMPEMDGFTATREIRARESGGSHVPIVAMTAHAVVGAREECLGAGMDDYITKPVSPQELERVLQKWGRQAVMAPEGTAGEGCVN